MIETYGEKKEITVVFLFSEVFENPDRGIYSSVPQMAQSLRFLIDFIRY